ncbi:hypothetical protein AGDE_15363 [Angomonas deanei]|nr:hypothetical protein AGDE_15363 [Angomonas deanei]|eukprot:EPY19211.1 hypothetical protein AGDE_15363 [Angomonas deanei]
MTQCISVFSVVLFVLLSLAFLLLFALVWVTHYKEVTSFETLLAPDGREGNTRGSQNKQSLIRTGVMLYGLFVFVLTLSYLESWRVQRTWEGTTTLDERFPLEYQMVRQKSQISFIAVGCAMNLFLLLLLKFRTAGYALLPSAVRARGGAQQESVLILSPAVLQLCHVIGNFCVMYVFGALVAVQFFFRNMDHGGNNSERMTGASLQVVLSCVLLLLLSNDDFLFRKLSRSERRYAPVLGMMFLWLAVGALQRAWTSASYLPLPYRIQETAFTALYCVLNLPSQLAAQSYLLRPSKGEPSIAYAPKTVLVTVVLSLIPLFFSGNPYVMWGSLISIAAHACRLYSAQFNTSKRRRM